MILIVIAAVVVAVTLVVLAGFMIPALIETRKTAVEIRNLAVRLDSEIQPVIAELRQTLADLRTITESASDKADNVPAFLDAVGDTGRSLRAINNVVGSVAGAITGSSLWLTGAKAAAKFLVKRYQRKGDTHHG